MRTQGQRDKITLGIGTAMAAVLVALAGAGLVTLLIHATIGMSDDGAERIFWGSSLVIAMLIVGRWLRRRPSLRAHR